MTHDACYICGKPIDSKAKSRDHVVPKALLLRSQPKVKGFDYAGTLPAHKLCNNQFGPEKYVTTAINLLEALHNPEVFFEYHHPRNPNFRMMAINSALLPKLTKHEQNFFEIIDATGRSKDDLHNLDLIKDRKPVNLKKTVLSIALSVLAKSAAALLVRRNIKTIPERWNILAIPYIDNGDGIDFDEILGDTEAFDLGLKVWVNALDSADFLVVYRVRRIVVFFLFQFSASTRKWNEMLEKFANATCLQFSGTNLSELIGRPWQLAKPL